MAADQPDNRNREPNELVVQLRQSLGLLRVAFDATEEAMLILDEHHHVRWVNRAAAQWFGNGLALKVIGKRFQQVATFRHPDQRDLSHEDYQHPLSQAKLGDGQMLLLIQPLLVNDSSLSTAVQRMVSWKPITELNEPYLLIVFRDLDPLEKALQQQRSFINKLAHELRTPLAIISGNLKRLSRFSKLDDAMLRPLEDVRSETKRMVGLVDKLVVLSELDTDQFAWSFERHPFQVFIELWLDSLDQEKRSLIQLSISEQCMAREVELDHSAFGRVMNNLFDNSQRFTSGTNPFMIHGSFHHDCIDLLVTDGGTLAVEDSRLTNVFDRFSKLEENRNPTFGEGSGLGLAVVKALVAGMNGTVKASLENNHDSEKSRGIKISIIFPSPNVINADISSDLEDID